MSEKPWERDWSGSAPASPPGGGKPWERNWNGTAGAKTPAPSGDLGDIVAALKGGDLPALVSTVNKVNASSPGGKSDFWDEVSRVFNNVNENWIAPSLGMPVDLVNQGLGLVGLGSDKPFGGTESLRSGMRDIGAAKGQDYMPKTAVGNLVSDVLGGAAAVLPMLATAGAAAPAVAPGVAKGVLTQMAAAPVSQVAAGAGAGVGDFAADRINPDDPWLRLGLQLTGALGGGMLTAPRQADPVIEAFERQNVPYSAGLTAGETAGGKAVQTAETGVLGTSIGGSGIIRNTYDRAQNAIGDAVDNLAGQMGTVQSADDLGRTLQGSVGRRMADVSQQADQAFSAIGNLFDPADRFLAQNAQRVLSSSFDNIDDPALAALVRDPRVVDFADALSQSGGQLSYNSLKGFRTYIGRIMDGLTLTSGTDNAQLKALYGALTDDMTSALYQKGGQQAVDAFNSANTWYATQRQMAAANLQPLVGKNQPVNAEKAFDLLYSAAKAKGGNLQRLQDIFSGLTPQEQGDVSASVLAGLGQKGTEPFSVERFLANYSQMSADAKDVLFNSQLTGPLRQSYDDLLETIMPQFRQGASRFLNRSNTGLAFMGGAQLLAANSLNLVSAVASIAGPAIMAKVMTNPTAVKLLAAMVARGQSAAEIAARVTALIQAQRQGHP